MRPTSAPAALRRAGPRGTGRRRRAVRVACWSTPRARCRFEDRNRVKDGDETRHPEFEIAKWSADPPDRRRAGGRHRLHVGRALPDVLGRARLDGPRPDRVRRLLRPAAGVAGRVGRAARRRCGRCRSARWRPACPSTDRRPSWPRRCERCTSSSSVAAEELETPAVAQAASQAARLSASGTNDAAQVGWSGQLSSSSSSSEVPVDEGPVPVERDQVPLLTLDGERGRPELPLRTDRLAGQLVVLGDSSARL